MLNSTRLTALFVASLAIPFSLRAQGTDCFANLASNVFTRVPVLIDTTPADSAAAAILPTADLLTQSVAEQVRKALGSESGPLPEGDKTTNWRQLGGSVIVTAHRDGTFTFRKDTAVSLSFMATTGLELITKALTETSAAGDRIFWPEAVPGDSLSFSLSFASPAVLQGGKLAPLRVRVANPVFTLMMPWMTPSEPNKPATIGGCPINVQARQ